MIQQEKKKLILASGAVVSLCLLISISLSDADDGCANFSEQTVRSAATNPVGIATQCLAKSKISWQAWVAGQSRSYQFHFFDLLELLYGGNNDGQVNPSQGTR